MIDSNKTSTNLIINIFLLLINIIYNILIYFIVRFNHIDTIFKLWKLFRN